MPNPSLDSFFFWNSGSEAVEAAIKMARTFTRRQNIICMQGVWYFRTVFSFTGAWGRWLSRTNVWCYGGDEKQDYLRCGGRTTHG